MTIAWFLSKLTLAGVFAFAAIAKFAGRDSSERTLVEFGLPASLARPGGILLPLMEVVVVVLLLVPRRGLWGGLAALTLLMIFAVAILVNIARGRTPDCHCFGHIRSKPIGWATLRRNVALAACATYVAWYQPASAKPLMGLPHLVAQSWFLASALGGVSVFVIGGHGWIVLHLLRQHGRLLARVHRLEHALTRTGIPLSTDTQPEPSLAVGMPAPAFELPSVSGEVMTLETLWRGGKPVVLIFSDPDCRPCQALMPDIGHWGRAYRQHLTVAVVSRGSIPPDRTKPLAYGDALVLLQRDREVATQYLAMSTPSAILVRPDGSIGSPLASGADAIRSLVENLMNHGQPPPWAGADAVPRALIRAPSTADATIGARAPAFRLSDLDGRVWESTELTGEPTVLIFWNPGCRFCNDMLPALRRWEAQRPTRAPRIVLISSGSVEVNRQLELRSTVLLDSAFGVGALMGASGTPSAIAIDQLGNIASPIAVGAERVLALAATEVSGRVPLTASGADRS